MPIIASPLLRIKLNKRINTHNSDTSLDRALKLLHLTHARFQHTSLNLIDDLPTEEIEAVVLVVLLAGEGFLVGVSVAVLEALGECVSAAELGDELGAVFGCVDGEGLWDYEEGGGEFADCELFAGALRRLDISEGWG
jgi:hypothetical protein